MHSITRHGRKCKGDTYQEARYIYDKYQKYQIGFLVETETGFKFAPSATRGNAAYAYNRRERYAEYQRAINSLAVVDRRRCQTNAFFITLTYADRQVNPPAAIISEYRRQLKKHGIQEAIITTEAHRSGYIHHHAVLIAKGMHGYYGHKGKQRSNSMRAIVRQCWPHGLTDTQAITETGKGGAGGYVMKELLKHAQCEKAVKKAMRGEVLNGTEEKQIKTLYFARRYRRRLISVSPKLSALGRTAQGEAETAADNPAALFKLSNNPKPRRVFMIAKYTLWAIYHRYGRPPPEYTGDMIGHGPIYDEIMKVATELKPKERRESEAAPAQGGNLVPVPA